MSLAAARRAATAVVPERRDLLKRAALTGAAGAGLSAAHAQPANQPATQPAHGGPQQAPGTSSKQTGCAKA